MPILSTDTELRSTMVRSLYRWWVDRSAGDVPDRADFEPADFKKLLPYLFIIDVEHAPFRIRYRLVGTRATEATGMDLTGRYLDELLPADAEEPWLEHYYNSYRDRRPLIAAINAPTTAGTRFTYEVGLFPIRKGGTAIDQFLAIEDYFNLTATLQELVEWRDGAPGNQQKRA